MKNETSEAQNDFSFFILYFSFALPLTSTNFSKKGDNVHEHDGH